MRRPSSSSGRRIGNADSDMSGEERERAREREKGRKGERGRERENELGGVSKFGMAARAVAVQRQHPLTPHTHCAMRNADAA